MQCKKSCWSLVEETKEEGKTFCGGMVGKEEEEVRPE